MSSPEEKAHISPPKHPMDKLLFMLTLVLLCVGIVTIYDASYAGALDHTNGDTLHFLKLQVVWGGVGLASLLVTRYIPYWLWRKYAVAGVAIAAILLVAVLVPHIGISVDGARRWVGRGSIRIQPSEPAKLLLILYLAHITTQAPKLMRRLKIGFMPPLVVIGVLSVLTAKEPDLGTAMVMGGTGLFILYLAGARRKHLLVTLGGVIIAVALYAVTSTYRMNRLTAFMNPRADRFQTGYQVWHALIALGCGGWHGLGLGEGREKLFIPNPHTDFIFSVIAEEWGLIGTLLLVTIFTLIAARGYSIAHQCKDPFGALLAAGITTMISLQALINIAVATSSIPNTGVPLPFLSYGGSALVFMMAGIGLMLNISCHPEGPPISVDIGKSDKGSLAEAPTPARHVRTEERVSVRGSARRSRPAASASRRIDRTVRGRMGLYRS